MARVVIVVFLPDTKASSVQNKFITLAADRWRKRDQPDWGGLWCAGGVVLMKEQLQRVIRLIVVEERRM
jgi:hypothetical protein